MADIQGALTRLALDPAYHDIFTILKGARNGLVYGTKIRFPHALVMSILFGRGSARDRLRFVFKATKQHATNLMKFVAIYKGITILQRRTNGGKPRSIDSFLGGLIGGWVVFGKRNAVNEQIVLYCTARVVSSLLPRQKVNVDWPAHKPIPTDKNVFQYFAAITWALVMWNFAERRQSLQNGLVNSMDYLYVNAEKWNSLRNLFWHNA
ncbi:peroxisomal membrane protein 4 [Tilletiaria anomala UBC 951]|uniref:Peroxisomal membrane protein 4 n=1 Tax=Tilletiaria anomala (strain ATCC 24038 / CBS 436.72 / UBC 951) TaxID=1037660 RepID=A0A066W4A6_TILAU|nr:peroxisomal membrane protein 4 [Tilletiaria anomala UBC 951]KDN45889.1 peroxisomal membrane protein 4 [Tilletiaria anomala UBC 951]